MSTTYKIQTGDTFKRIASIVYADSSLSTLIERSNPGVNEPLILGQVIFIPDDPIKLPSRSLINQDVSENEITLVIDGERFRYWSSLRIRRSIDNIDTIDVEAVFEPDNLAFKELFKPFSYKTIIVFVGEEPLFTGTLVNITPVIANNKNFVSLNAYSTPGVLAECTLPLNDGAKFEFYDVDLKTIADSLCAPFGIGTKFINEAGSNFSEGVFLREDAKILQFLKTLAQQKNLVISSSENGALQFQKSISSGSVVAKLAQGYSPLTGISAAFKPQQYYSHIVGIESEEIGEGSPEIEVRINPRLAGVLRPLTFIAPDSDETDIDKATDAKFGRMFANSVSYDIKLSTWRDDFGNLFKPNTLISIIAPRVMIYTDYTFVIRNVEFNKTAQSEICSLNVMLVGGFDGKSPGSMPWDE